MTMPTVDRPVLQIVLPQRKLTQKRAKGLCSLILASWLEGLPTFLKYSLFFGAAVLGSAIAYVILNTLAFWIVYQSIAKLGYSSFAFYAYAVTLFSSWITSTLAWFNYLDRTFP